MNLKLSILTITFCTIFTASNISKASKKAVTNVFCRNKDGLKKMEKELESIEWLQNKINTTKKLSSLFAKTTIITPWLYPLYAGIKTKKIPSWKSLLVSGAITATGWWWNKSINADSKRTLTDRINDLDEMIGNEKSWNEKIINHLSPYPNQLLQNFKTDNSAVNELKSYKKTVKAAQSNLRPLKSIANKLKKINTSKTIRIHIKLCHFIEENSDYLNTETDLIENLKELKK